VPAFYYSADGIAVAVINQGVLVKIVVSYISVAYSAKTVGNLIGVVQTSVHTRVEHINSDIHNVCREMVVCTCAKVGCIVSPKLEEALTSSIRNNKVSHNASIAIDNRHSF
jgi:hypothetical protein